jgi:hypothetical protein
VGFSAALAARAQIISVTTAEMGPAGPVKRLFAVAVDTRAAALEEIERRRHVQTFNLKRQSVSISAVEDRKRPKNEPPE